MHYTIYVTINLINGKFYVGKHETSNPNDRYFGSGKALLAAIKIYGRTSFIKIVIGDFATREEMDAAERSIVTEEFIGRPDTYNAGVGGEGGPQYKGRKHSPETIERLRTAATKNKTSCPSGHELSQGNIWITNKGCRRCLTCKKQHARKWKEKNKRQKRLGVVQNVTPVHGAG